MEGFQLNIETDDLTLVNAFNNGERRAFNLIVLKYQKRIYRIIRKMVLSHDDADDITQEVFIKIHESLKDFRGDSRFFTYIYRIAINYSLNHLNKAKRNNHRTVDIDTESYRLKADDGPGEDDYDSIFRKDLLNKAIASLPEQQKAVFMMRYYDNLNYEEIASILNKSVGGMKANYFHAFKKIQEYVKKKDKVLNPEV